MSDEDSLFGPLQPEITGDKQKDELSELIARYRVAMNKLVGSLMYLERLFARSSTTSATLVSGFVDQFLGSCAEVPANPEEWDGGKCYTSEEAYESIIKMYRAARDLRRLAKRIVTLRRHFYRDLTILHRRHAGGQSAFDREANLRITQRKQWTSAERKEIWENSERSCRYCGTMLENWEGEVMHVDHIVPVIAGGSDDLTNLAAACVRCNLKKNAKSEEAFLAEILATGKSQSTADFLQRMITL